jgi:ESCRT-I complex subunit VPS28
MDALKLNLRAKDQLHPFLSDLMAGYSRFKGSGEWEGRGKILGWLIELNGLRASEEITEEQSRQVSPPPRGVRVGDRDGKRAKKLSEKYVAYNVQMLFDIEHAYNEFFRSLSSGSKSS